VTRPHVGQWRQAAESASAIHPTRPASRARRNRCATCIG